MRDRIRVVLRVRKAQEQQAQARVAEAERSLRASAAEHAARTRSHGQHQTAVGDLSPLQLRTLQLQGLASYAELVAAARAEDEARAVRENAAAEQTASSVRRRGAERLVERRQDALAAVVARNVQSALDELAIARWRDR